MLRRRGSGQGWGSIADWLNQVAPRDDGKFWTATSVQRLCAKRVYRGEASRYVDQDVDGRGPIINREAHPPLVTEEEWQAAQMTPRLEANGNGSLPLLSSLIRCAGCRYSMSIGRGPKGERMYRCRSKYASGQCPRPTQVLADTIEEYVEETVLTEIDGIAKIVSDSTERERIAADLAQAQSDLEDFRNDTAARRKLSAEWHEWLDRYLDRVRSLQAELEQTDQRIGIMQQGLTRDHYLDLPVSDRREVLGGFFDCLFVRRSRGRGRHVDPIDSRVRILWRGQAPADLPRRRVVNVIRPYDFEDHVEAGVAPAQDAA